MSKMIISKKGKMPTGFVALSTLAILAAAFFFFTLPEKSDFDDAEMMGLITFATPFLFLFLGVYGIASGMRYSNSYINIYDDHIEGYGVLGKGGNRGQNFNFNNSIKYTANLEGSYLSINCNNVSYYMYLPLAEARQVYDILVNPGRASAGSYTASAPKTPEPPRTYNTAGSFKPASSLESSGTHKLRCTTDFIDFTCPKCKASFKVNTRVCPETFNCIKCGEEYHITYKKQL